MATQLKEPDSVIEAPDEPQSDGRDYEAEATLRGWKPPTEFGEGGVDAKTFVERGEQHLGLAKATIEQLNKRVRVLEGMNKKLSRMEQSAFSNAMATLKAQMKEAVATGDEVAFDALDAKAETLRKEMASPQTHGEDANSEYVSFREANPWYDKANLASASEIEVEARLFADRLSDKYVAEGLTQSLKPSEFFERVAQETKEKFPTLGTRAPREKPTEVVAGVTRTGVSRSAKTGANLPADAKAAAERYMTHKVGAFAKCKTKAEAHDLFAKDFDWSEAR